MPVLSVSKEALSAIRDRLVAAGFRKRTGEIYTRPLDGDVLGWMGMQHARRPGGAVAIAPTVGVRHPAVERLVYAFDGSEGRPRVLATLANPLGYLFPKPDWRQWMFSPEESFDPVLDRMVGAITRYGVPYMYANSDPDAAANELARLPGSTLEGPKRRGIIDALQGRPAEAVAALGALFVQVENWSTGRAESLRFLENFSAYFDIPTVE